MGGGGRLFSWVGKVCFPISFSSLHIIPPWFIYKDDLGPHWLVLSVGATLRFNTDKNLIDALSTAHPTFLTKEEINNVAVPVQILAPETDPRFTPELKEHANKVIPTLGVEYDYQYFPGLAHGFACRADEGNEVEKRGLERAKNAVSGWFGVMLH